MNVIVISLTVTECWVNLFLSMIKPVRPVEVGGAYLIILRPIWMGCFGSFEFEISPVLLGERSL